MLSPKLSLRYQHGPVHGVQAASHFEAIFSVMKGPSFPTGRMTLMEPHIRVQRLAPTGIVLAFGAILMGMVGLMMSWMGSDGTARLPLMLVLPGGLIVAAAAYLLYLAMRARPESWQKLYRVSARLLNMFAMVSFISVVVVGFLVHSSAPIIQTLLVAAVGLQSPLVMVLLARMLGKSADRSSKR